MNPKPNPTNRLYAIVAIVVGLLVVFGLAIQGLSSNNRTVSLSNSAYSPYTGTTSAIATNGTGGGALPSAVATGQFNILDLDSLPFPYAVKSNLEQHLTTALNTVTTPGADATYIQVDVSTIKCNDQYDCAFSFYLDSPESYYNYHQYYKSGGQAAFTIKPAALAGANQ